MSAYNLKFRIAITALVVMCVVKMRFLGKTFSNPRPDEGKVPQSFMRSNFSENSDLLAIQTNRDKFLSWPGKRNLCRLQLTNKVSDTMRIPEPAFFFKGPKFWYSVFHNYLPPLIKSAFRLRHRARSNYFGFMLAQIFKYYRKAPSALRLPQGKISVVPGLQYEWTRVKTNFFRFLRFNTVLGYMQDAVFVPNNICYLQGFTSAISIIRNTKDVKQNLPTGA